MRPLERLQGKRRFPSTSATAGGFTYLTALLAVALMGAGLAVIGELWHTAMRREREAELLFVGEQYRKAIRRYYMSGTPRRYPRALADLLEDARKPGVERHLRQLYPDPLGGAEWGIVNAPDGGIAGVRSLSQAVPLKKAGFRLRERRFESAAKYSDWEFVFDPEK